MRKDTHEHFRKVVEDADTYLSFISDRIKGFKYRVGIARDWWNKHLLEEKPGSFLIGSRLNVNDVECLCMYVEISVSGNVCKFDVRPLRVDQDAGSGPGRTRTIEF